VITGQFLSETGESSISYPATENSAQYASRPT